MGQKTHPYGFRLGFNKDWKSRWFAEGIDYVDKLHEDLKLRRYIKKTHENAGIQEVIIERVADSITLYIYTARPGVIIGRGGSKLQEIRTNIQKDFNKQEVAIEIKEVSKPELSAQLTAEGVAVRLEKRTAFRRAMRMAVAGALKCGALGIKIMVAGRLGGAEIARTEWYLQGKVPLQTLKADIDYGFFEACTTYGKIGVKVWIYKGEKLKEKSMKRDALMAKEA